MRTPDGDDFSGGGAAEPSNARLYDKLECALIAMEYALADARACEDFLPLYSDCFARSHEALQSAGGEVRDVLIALKMRGPRSAVARAPDWD